MVPNVAESLAGDMVRSRLIVMIDSECPYPRYGSQIQHAQGNSKPSSLPAGKFSGYTLAPRTFVSNFRSTFVCSTI